LSLNVAIKRDGSLWQWGNQGRRAPARVGSDLVWVAAWAGVNHSVALREDGSLWAWGSNDNGQGD